MVLSHSSTLRKPFRPDNLDCNILHYQFRPFLTLVENRPPYRIVHHRQATPALMLLRHFHCFPGADTNQNYHFHNPHPDYK